MGVLTCRVSLLWCLLLSCLPAGGLGSSRISRLNRQGDSGPTLPLEHLDGFPTLQDAAVQQLAELVRTSVLQATAEAQGELASRLDQVQSSLEKATQSSLEKVTQLADRLEAVDKAVAGIRESVSPQQVSMQKSEPIVFTRQPDYWRRVADDPSHDQNTNRRRTRSAGFTCGQKILSLERTIEHGIADYGSRVDDLLDVVASRQDLEKVRQELQDSITAQRKRDEVISTTLASLSDTQQEVKKAVSDHLANWTPSRLNNLLEPVASRQDLQNVFLEMRHNITEQRTRDEVISNTLASLSDTQQEVKKVVSDQTRRLEGLAESLVVLSGRLTVVIETSRTPVPADRPSLITGRLLGEPCRSDTDCSVLRTDTVCGGDGRCQCAAGLQPVAGEACRPYPRLSEPCRATSDCRGATALAVCADSRCSCPPGLFNYNNTACRSGLGIGEPCHYDSDCSTAVGLTCNNDACALRTCDPPRNDEISFRLVGGRSCSEGLLQNTFNSGRRWQYMCDSNWTQLDAAVACRYLGFSGGVTLSWNNSLVDMDDLDNFLSVEDLRCVGSERSLMACRPVLGRKDCRTGKLAGVQCSGL